MGRKAPGQLLGQPRAIPAFAIRVSRMREYRYHPCGGFSGYFPPDRVLFTRSVASFSVERAFYSQPRWRALRMASARVQL